MVVEDRQERSSRGHEGTSPLRGRASGVVGLLRARELTLNLARRDLTVRHRGTFLGMVWSMATPLLMVGIYYFVFKFVLGAHPAIDRPRPDGNDIPFAVYLFAGLTIWNFFSRAVGTSTESVIGSGHLLGKVYFPRAILPLSTVLSNLITLGFEMVVLLVVIVVTVGPPSVHLLWVPMIVLVSATLVYGLALLLSGLTVFLRDVSHFIGVLLQILFWGTPIIYSMQYAASRPGLVRLLELNPITGVVVSFRNVVLLNRPPDFRLLAYDLVVGAVVLVVGWRLFARWQRLFAEIV